jgi:hypothetical protein
MKVSRGEELALLCTCNTDDARKPQTPNPETQVLELLATYDTDKTGEIGFDAFCRMQGIPLTEAAPRAPETAAGGEAAAGAKETADTSRSSWTARADNSFVLRRSPCVARAKYFSGLRVKWQLLLRVRVMG